MPSRVSGKRYAQAIFELAVENGQVDQWANDLGVAGQVLQDPEFRAFLQHAKVPLDKKISAVGAVLADVHPLVRNLIDLMVAKGLVVLASELGSSYTELLDIHHGRQRDHPGRPDHRRPGRVGGHRRPNASRIRRRGHDRAPAPRGRRHP